MRGLRGQAFPKLKEKYIDTGKVRYIMREYPLDGLAAAAFMLARCAGPDKYYPLIETLFAQQQKWAVREPIPPLLAIAKQAGFTQQSFEACINDKALLNKVQQVRDRASQKFKVDATPTFFINGETPSGRDVDRRDRQDHRSPSSRADARRHCDISGRRAALAGVVDCGRRPVGAPPFRRRRPDRHAL